MWRYSHCSHRSCIERWSIATFRIAQYLKGAHLLTPIYLYSCNGAHLLVPSCWCPLSGASLFSNNPLVETCWCPPFGAPQLVPTSLKGVQSKPWAPVWSADKQTIGWLVLISWTAAYQRTRLYIDASNSYRSHITLLVIILSPQNHSDSRNQF